MSVTLEFNRDLLWLSDWDGSDIGHDDVNVLGLYRIANTELYVYIDMDTNKIVDGFGDMEE